MTPTTQITELIARGALFVVNHSGGKDSQAMFIRLRSIIPGNQLIVVHATLGEVEWQGSIEHIQETTAGFEFYTCQNKNKTFLEMVERRGMFPSKGCRQCTSDLKRDPIASKIKEVARTKGRNIIVNCMGLRAQESSDRSKLATFTRNERYTYKGPQVSWEWYDWLPIHELSTSEVFEMIAAAGEKPHWAYAAGMTRVSCCFCILSSKGDLQTAARLRPELYKKYVELEKKINHTLQMGGKGLEQITGIQAA